MPFNQYAQQINDAANNNGVDPALFTRLIQQESGFNPNSKGTSGEVGLGQLMPATAQGLGVDPNDIGQNLDGSARYLKQQMDTFGHPQLALAAYNAGPGRVNDFLKNGRQLPSSTNDYVHAISGSPLGASGQATQGALNMAGHQYPPQPDPNQGALNGQQVAGGPGALFGGQTPVGAINSFLQGTGGLND